MTEPASRSPWFRLALGALLLVGAATDWERVFPAGPMARTAAVAIAVPTALVAVHRLRPLPLWLVLCVAVGGWLALIPLALPAGSSANPAWALHALRTSWYDLLTTAPPAPADPALLIGVYALLWCAAWATGEALTRGRKVLPALSFAFAVLLAGVLLGTGGRRAGLLAAGLFTVCALLLLTEPASWHRAAAFGTSALGTVVAIVTAAVVLAPAVTGDRQPYDPRHLVHPPAQPAAATDLLDRVPGWLAHPATPLFHVSAPTAQNWRLAALDRFDGRTWTSADEYWPVTTHLPGVDKRSAGPAIQPFPQHITIDALSGPWLPAAPTPTALDTTGLPGVLADPATESLLTRTPLEPGRSYQVTSGVPDLTAAQLAAAVPDPAAQPDTGLPSGLPQVVADTAEQAVAGATSPFQQASHLERYLRDTEHNDAAAPPGHTYGHLAYFLGVSHRGTSEQFATAFAVLARSVGLPSRVVVGFRPGDQTAPGVWQVNGADAFVWPEVDFAGLGWVPFFPTPGAASSTADSATPAEGQTAERARLDQALDATQQPPGNPATGPTPAGQPKPMRTADDGETWVIWTALAAAVPFGYLAVVLGVPWLRRRRGRRLPVSAQSVHAAWRATLGRLRRIGVTDVAALTNSEVAALAAERLGGDAGAHLAPLAGLADTAAFAADPGRDLDPDKDLRSAAWSHHDHLAVLIRRRAGARATLWHTVRPRALRD